MKKNKDKSLLDDRRLAALLSLLIAIIIWTIVTVSIEPNTTVSLDNVPVNFTYDAKVYTTLGLDIVNQPQAKVSIKLSGDGAYVGGLNESDLIVYPDYSAVKGAGSMELPLKVRLLDSSLTNKITAEVNKKVSVVFDEVVEKELTVRVELPTDVTIAEGYVLKSSAAAPGKVVAKGPKSEINKIHEVLALVPSSPDLQNLSDSKLATVPLEVRDENGQPLKLEYTTLDADLVDVNIAVYQTVELPLVVNFINYPANFNLSNLKYTISPNTITISDKPSVVQSLTEISVSDFDLAASFELNKSYQLAVELPQKVDKSNNITAVTLSFDTTGLAERTLNVSNIRVINQPANLVVSANSTKLSSVTLIGPEEELANLSPSSVVAVIDASDSQVKEGTESLSAHILVPSSPNIFAIGVYTVECTTKTKGAA